MEPSDVVRAFITQINCHDLDGLCSLMVDDHVFIDSLGNRAVGRPLLLDAWRAYFQLVPDYWIDVDTIMQEGNNVAVFGHAGGSYRAECTEQAVVQGWQVPAAWQAEVSGGLVVVWRVYADNLPLRQLMGLEKLP